MSTEAENIVAGNAPGAGIFHQGEELFRALIENSSDAIALVSEEGLFTYVSPSVEKMLGYTPAELVGRDIRDFFPPQYFSEIAVQFAVVTQAPDRVVTVEHLYLHKNGSPLWIESTITNRLHNPAIHAYVANFRDITTRRQASAHAHLLNVASDMLVASIDHQLTLQEIAHLIVPALADYCRIGILDETNRIKEIAAHHADPAQTALVGQLYEQYKDRESTAYGIQKLLATGQPELIPIISERVLDIVRDNPELIATTRSLGLRSYMGVPLIAHGRIIGAITFSSIQPARRYSEADLRFAQELARRIALTLDNGYLYQQAQEEIQERKKAEDALRASEQRKDEFIGMASHELKTPITALKGFTNVLQRRLSKQSDAQSLYYLARMDVQLDKITKLISDLLDITRMQSGKLVMQQEVLDLDTVVRETIETLQAATETHRLRIEGGTGARIMGDKDRLAQVFINLITNAIKYSPHADTVIVRLSKAAEQAIVSVQDFGIGIAETHQQHIFERFYQVADPDEKTYPGLGIGLYISQEIVERHHGRIWLESAKGAGATFYVALPLSEGEK
jgi:PAS domain S-box-containing protein